MKKIGKRVNISSISVFKYFQVSLSKEYLVAELSNLKRAIWDIYGTSIYPTVLLWESQNHFSSIISSFKKGLTLAEVDDGSFGVRFGSTG